jgi:hypothetical protein
LTHRKTQDQLYINRTDWNHTTFIIVVFINDFVRIFDFRLFQNGGLCGNTELIKVGIGIFTRKGYYNPYNGQVVYERPVPLGAGSAQQHNDAQS